jgi:hypothetical protein
MLSSADFQHKYGADLDGDLKLHQAQSRRPSDRKRQKTKTAFALPWSV